MGLDVLRCQADAGSNLQGILLRRGIFGLLSRYTFVRIPGSPMLVLFSCAVVLAVVPSTSRHIEDSLVPHTCSMSTNPYTLDS